MVPKYDYRPLDSAAGEFRLLTILPEIYSQQTSAAQGHTRTGESDASRRLWTKLDELTRMIEKSTFEASVEASSQSPKSEIRNHEWHKALAKLVEMGYSTEKAKQALTESEAGTDISAALEWLTVDEEWQARRKMCLESRDAVSAAKSSQGHFGRPSKLPVECILEKVSFSQPGLEYMALSYTWGDPLPTASIIIDGKTVEVGENLEAALRHIRQPSKPVNVWADAVSINQSDDQEKSKQVLRMRDIYQHASSVVVWLGSGTEDSNKAMDAISSIGKVSLASGISTLSAKDFRNYHDSKENVSLAYIKGVVNSIAKKVGKDIPYSAIKQLSLRPYFTRIWIIQEVALGREVTFVCGTRRVAFAHFAAATTFLTSYSLQKTGETAMKLSSLNLAELKDSAAVIAKCKELEAQAAENAKIESPDSAASVLFMTRYRYQASLGSSPETLYSLLRRELVGNSKRIAAQRVTNVKDIVYGLLGLASDREKLGIKPDYSESKSVEHVFTEATRRMIRYGHLGLLTWCQHPRRLHKLPSWVPDFSSRIYDPCGEVQRHRLFNASGKREWGFVNDLLARQYPSTDLLKLTCAKVCTIEHLALTAWNLDPDADFDLTAANKYFTEISWHCQFAQFSYTSSYLKTWKLQSPQDMEKIKKHQKALDEAEWRIPTGDLERSGVEMARATPRLQIGYEDLRKAIKERSSNPNYPFSPAAEVYKLALDKMVGRKPFRSADVFVGLVPARAQLKDVIAIVDGADVPFVFRSHEGEGQDQYWELIGEAYVHTTMDGEFAAKEDKREVFRAR